MSTLTCALLVYTVLRYDIIVLINDLIFTFTCRQPCEQTISQQIKPITFKSIDGFDRYGSIYEDAVDFMLRECGLRATDRFLDIGSGIGQIVMQAAAWAGCPSAVSNTTVFVL